MRTVIKTLLTVAFVLLAIPARSAMTESAEAANEFAIAGKQAFEKRDYAKAATLYLKAAELGNADGQMGIYALYSLGWGVPRDRVKAIGWCEKAAEQGLDRAQYCLGVAYRDGDGVDIDYSKALFWFHKAAEQRHVDAIMSISGLYYSGRGVDKDIGSSIWWCLKAANLGNDDSQYRLANLYYEMGSYTEAAKWYKASSAKGNTSAQDALSRMYVSGIGVPQNYAEALKILRKRSESEPSMFNLSHYDLGMMYKLGRGVPQDFVLAYMWFSIASITEHEFAIKERNLAASKLSSAQLAKAQQLAGEWKQKK